MIDINGTANVDLLQINGEKFKNIDTKHVEDDRLRQVANDFEAYFMQQIMDSGLKTTNIAGEGPGSHIVKGMYTQQLSQQTAGSMGISDMLYQFLSENNRK